MFGLCSNDTFEIWFAQSARLRLPSDVASVLDDDIRGLDNYGMFNSMPGPNKTKKVPPNPPPSSESPPATPACDPNCMQTRGATGNKRYQNAIFCITHDDEANIPESLTSPIAERAQPQQRNTVRNRRGPNPPTKQTDAQRRRQREKKRQQRLARNEQEDFSNDISRMFDANDDQTLSRPITPPSSLTEPPTAHLSPLLPSIPPQFAPPRSHGLQRITPIEARPTIRPNAIPMSDENALQKITKNRAKDVWLFFSKTEENTICMLCNQRGGQRGNGIYSTTTSTGVLRGHLIKEHQSKYIEACLDNNWQPKGIMKDVDLDANEMNSRRYPFTMPAFRKGLVEWIVGFDESINLVEYPPFRNWILMLRESLQSKDIPHRSTVRRLISSIFLEHFKMLKEEMRLSEGMISLTVDGWDDKSMRAYLGVTAHFLRRKTDSKSARGSLQLQSYLIAFVPTPGRHTGQVLAKALLRVTDWADITGRVRAITTDGAANMAAMLEDYEHLLRAQGIYDFDALNSHIICFPHTLHLAVNKLIDTLTTPGARYNSTAAFSSPVDEPCQLDQQSLADALKRDPIAISRDIINTIRMSQIRRDEFLSMIEFGNKKEKWKTGQKVVILPKVVPFRDVPHRWGSGYLSLQRMRLLQQPITFYTEKRADIFMNRLTDIEWTVLEHICDILERPFILQEQMSRERTPMLANSLPAYESVLAALEKKKDSPRYAYLRGVIQAGINDMRTSYNGRQFSKLLILALIIHPSLRMKWFECKWPRAHVEYARELILEELNKYRSLADEPLVNDTYQSPQKATKFKLFDDLWEDTSSNVRFSFTVEEELRDYCQPGSWPNPEKVDILEWWDINSERYPTLFRLALDILPIQASSVAAERAFSSASETDTPKRSRITPALMEELQLLKNIVNKHDLNFTEHWHCMEEDIEAENKFQDMVEGWVTEDRYNGSDDDNESSGNESFNLDNVGEQSD